MGILQQLELTVTKFNSDSYPNGRSMSFNPDNFGYIFDNGTYRTCFYDGLNKSRLDVFTTTAALQTILTECENTGFVGGLVVVDFLKIMGVTQSTKTVVTTPSKTITGATNASPIVITSASHGFSSGNRVKIHGVVGNTAANGIYYVTVINANSFSIWYNSARTTPVVGNHAYTSGGIAQLYVQSTQYTTGAINSSRVGTSTPMYDGNGSIIGTLLFCQFQRTRYEYNQQVIIRQQWANSEPPVVSPV